MTVKEVDFDNQADLINNLIEDLEKLMASIKEYGLTDYMIILKDKNNYLDVLQGRTDGEGVVLCERVKHHLISNLEEE
jgi:hypothetical protein